MNTVTIEGITLRNVHDEVVCAGRHCVIHNPIVNHMSDWPLQWRDDRGIFERICPCGIGHPEMSQADYWQDNNQSWQLVHGCCGHCADPTEEKT